MQSSNPARRSNPEPDSRPESGPGLEARSNLSNYAISIAAAICFAILVFIFQPQAQRQQQEQFHPYHHPGSDSSAADINTMSTTSKQQSGEIRPKVTRTPVYFISHGGPNLLEDDTHEAYRQLKVLGKEITKTVKPKAVVVFSAHWQGREDTVLVNTEVETDLIYDFYGFPRHYYDQKYENFGSKVVAEKVINAIKEAGMNAEGVKRGLDHGVWACFKCAFDPSDNPLGIPIVQASLFDTDDPNQHYRLGQAISKLREENIMIVVSGMAVHNLRDLVYTDAHNRQPFKYTIDFEDALKDAATSSPSGRQKAMADLLLRGDARRAHPSFEHLLPIHIGAGAAGEDVGERLWTFLEGSVSWAQYRFGGLP